jgi:hypothetical protein
MTTLRSGWFLNPDSTGGFGSGGGAGGGGGVGNAGVTGIRHSTPGLGGGRGPSAGPLPGAGGAGGPGAGGGAPTTGGGGGAGTGGAGGEGAEVKPQIKALEQGLGSGRHLENWKRKPTPTGHGAVHCRSFHCKLTGDSLENLDRQINEWLDAHPDYEVKLVTTTVGEWTGKLKEPNLIVQVWV